MIAVGVLHTLIIDSENNVWASGANSNGELGLGNISECSSLQKVVGLPPIIHVATPIIGSHSLFLDQNGEVWACGNLKFNFNNFGLSIDSALVVTPTKIPLPVPIIMIACGQEHTVVLDQKGRVWGCGTNSNGELGLKEFQATEFTIIPTQQIGHITKVACGDNFTLVKNEQGELWGCGHNIGGGLGLGHNEAEVHTLTKIPLESDVVVSDFCCGFLHTLLLDDKGRVWSTGYNPYGQLGQGDYNERNLFTHIQEIPEARHIICGGEHSIVVDVDGNALGCGNMWVSEMANPWQIVFPVLISNLPSISHGVGGWRRTFLVDNVGEVWHAGDEHSSRGIGALGKFTKQKFGFTVGSNNRRFWNTKRAT